MDWDDLETYLDFTFDQHTGEKIDEQSDIDKARLNFLQFIQQLSGTKPPDHRPTMTEWNDDQNLDRELRALLQYQGFKGFNDDLNFEGETPHFTGKSNLKDTKSNPIETTLSDVKSGLDLEVQQLSKPKETKDIFPKERQLSQEQLEDQNKNLKT